MDLSFKEDNKAECARSPVTSVNCTASVQGRVSSHRHRQTLSSCDRQATAAAKSNSRVGQMPTCLGWDRVNKEQNGRQ